MELRETLYHVWIELADDLYDLRSTDRERRPASSCTKRVRLAAAGTSDGAGQTAAPARGMAPLDGAMRLVLRVLETLNREGEADGRADGTTGRPGTRGGSRCAPLRHAPTDSASCACTGAREGSSPLLSALHRAEEGFRLGLELLKLLKALDTC